MTDSPFTLHDYQSAAVSAALAGISGKRADLIVSPTGSGKSLMLAETVKRLLPTGQRALIVTHVREIISQNTRIIDQHIPGLDYGVYCAGLQRFEPGKQIVIGSIQSLYRRSYGRGFDVLLIDEAQMLGTRHHSMYRQLIQFLRRAGVPHGERRLPIIGFTATPYRLDSGYLHQGEDALFSRIAYDVPIRMLLERGILAPLTTEPVEQIDFADLPVRAGDYQVKAFEEHTAWLQETARSLAIVRRLAASRRKWVIFACSIRHALAIAEMLTAEGISAIAMHHRLPPHERDEAMLAFRQGDCRVLVNVDMLGVGFDAPHIDCIVSLRPTLSTGRWIQYTGRGMRAFPGKRDCLLLDFASNLERHGPMTDVTPEVRAPLIAVEPGRVTRKQPSTKLCPTCATELLSLQRQCTNCGRLFMDMSIAPSVSDPLYLELDDEVEVITCSAEGCNQTAKQAGLCYTHYEAYRRAKPGLCRVTGCEHPARRIGLCNVHYKRALRAQNANLLSAKDLVGEIDPGVLGRAYVEQRPGENGLYYYNRKVPVALRAKLDRNMWTLSLKTRDEATAYARARRVTTKLDALIASLKPNTNEKPPASDYPYLATEEAATAIGINKWYAKQMRHYGTGPRFYTGGGVTNLGWRQVVYRREDIDAWRATRVFVRGRDGRSWRIHEDNMRQP